MKVIEDYNKVLSINELYEAIQGEGSRAGLPTIVIRTLGCQLRCFFGEEGGFCDSWRNSWKLEKGIYTFNDIIKMYDDRPDITEMMLTVGGPSMHPALINSLCNFCHERGIIMTIETEGSQEIHTDKPIHLVSISPKFSNTTPIVGLKTEWGREVTQNEVDKHEKNRTNPIAIQQLINSHLDFQIKPVVNPSSQPEIWNEVLDFIKLHNIPKDKIWIMPPGDSRDKLIKTYPDVINFCVENGYNFTGRPHIMAFDTRRLV